MAEVYLALCYGASGFEKRVAVKRLLPAMRGIAEYERLLIEEAVLGAQLEHQNLVAVLDLGTDSGSYFACLELVDGADLGTLCDTERPAVELALLIAHNIAEALEYVHEATDARGRPLGLVHRDVSPSNVLVSRRGAVKLADFGIAKATRLADKTLGNLRKGTYSYMSPEQVEGRTLSPQSDQFGFGVLLCELLCGRRVFDGDTVMATLENISAAEPPELGELPDDVAAIVGRCINRDPGDRFSTPGQLRDAVAAARKSRAAADAPELASWVRSILG